MPALSTPRQSGQLSVAQAATRVGCAPRTILRYIHTGLLPATRIGSKAIVIDERDLAAITRPVLPAGGPV